MIPAFDKTQGFLSGKICRDLNGEGWVAFSFLRLETSPTAREKKSLEFISQFLSVSIQTERVITSRRIKTRLSHG